MMSLLVTLSLGVSMIVINDVSTVRTVMAGVQARYAAEGMNEIGLQLLDDHLPGYETSIDSRLLQSSAVASLDIHARDFTVPCSGEWRRLAFNESIQLPLFAELENGATENIEQFYVEFYLGDENGLGVLYDRDVLRWKIIGFRNDRPDVTEAISEFIPLHEKRFTKEDPSVFGPSIDEAAPDGYARAKYYDSAHFNFFPNYPISEFLQQHGFSHLILTNLATAYPNHYVYFRLHSLDRPAVCEFVTLQSSADLSFGSSRQSLETLVKEGENLPVFDFVLYNTEE